MTNREIAEKIFLAGVRSVLPEQVIKGIMSLRGSVLTIGYHNFPLSDIHDIWIIGAGKASAAMGHYVEKILGDRIKGGHIVVKYDHSCKLKKIAVTEAGHPVPDRNGFKATEEIVSIASKASLNDLIICLISGGGSALFADLPAGLLPEELYVVNNLLVRSGASISEINCVRKHLSGVKGGQLSKIAWPANIVSLILSDVTGNPLDVIASGPTAPDPSTFSDALAIIDKYGLESGITAGVLKYLKEGSQGLHPETPKPGDPVFSRTFNLLIGTNKSALDASKEYAVSLGFNVNIMDQELQGNAETVAEKIICTALSFKTNKEIQKPVCLLYGGEPTLKVRGNGLGGRNQHLALSAALRLQEVQGITFLSAGTDGSDGPTDAAGAVVDCNTVLNGKARKADPAKYLEEFDSYNFFRIAGGHINTGPTYTNVMDIVAVLIE
ncbi:MAG: glycerate kinase [Bacteroidota bacterium]|nr:glycerate kinase [Bacteroidota bacterium]